MFFFRVAAVFLETPCNPVPCILQLTIYIIPLILQVCWLVKNLKCSHVLYLQHHKSQTLLKCFWQSTFAPSCLGTNTVQPRGLRLEPCGQHHGRECEWRGSAGWGAARTPSDGDGPPLHRQYGGVPGRAAAAGLQGVRTPPLQTGMTRPHQLLCEWQRSGSILLYFLIWGAASLRPSPNIAYVYRYQNWRTLMVLQFNLNMFFTVRYSPRKSIYKYKLNAWVQVEFIHVM